MNKKLLKYTGFVALSLLCVPLVKGPLSNHLQAEINTEKYNTPRDVLNTVATNAVLNIAAAQKTILKFLDQPEEYVAPQELIEALQQTSDSFRQCTIENTPEEIFAALINESTHFTQEIQERIESMTEEQFCIIYNERKAMTYFKEQLLMCPVNQTPSWENVVDTITGMLQNSSRYAKLCTALQGVKTPTGWTEGIKKLKVYSRLRSFITTLPTDIQKTVNSKSASELSSRIKLS